MAPRSLWQEDEPGPPAPALAGDAEADVVVVGAGVTGGACAARLRDHGVDVCVLEAASAGAGASGRNGGVAAAGSALAFAGAVDRLGAADALRLHRLTEGALARMVERAAAAGRPDAIRRRGTLWIGEEDAPALRRSLALMQAAGIDCREAPELVPPALAERTAASLYVPRDAELHPAAWVNALVAGASRRGARLFERSPVVDLRRDGGGWRAVTAHGTVSAAAVVVACDGRVARVVPALRRHVYPVRNQMLATEPLARPPIAVPTVAAGGHIYARTTADGRLAVGGRRDVDRAAEYTCEEGENARIQAALERFVRRDLRLADVAITHRWSGVMGFSADLVPVVGELPGEPGLWVAAGYSGSGNVQGFACGEMVADLVAGRGHPDADLYALARFVRDGALAPPAAYAEPGGAQPA